MNFAPGKTAVAAAQTATVAPAAAIEVVPAADPMNAGITEHLAKKPPNANIRAAITKRETRPSRKNDSINLAAPQTLPVAMQGSIDCASQIKAQISIF